MFFWHTGESCYQMCTQLYCQPCNPDIPHRSNSDPLCRETQCSPSITEPPWKHPRFASPARALTPSDSKAIKSSWSTRLSKIWKKCQLWLQKTLLFYTAVRLTGLWIWGQGLLSFLSQKGSHTSEGPGVQSKTLLHRQTGAWAGCNVCSTCNATNPHRHLPWPQSRSARRPPFLVTWALILGCA